MEGVLSFYFVIEFVTEFKEWESEVGVVKGFEGLQSF